MSSEIEAALAFQVLVPRSNAPSMEAFLEDARRTTLEPFAAERVSALDDLSQRVLRHPRLRRDPAGVALGFWLRRSHVTELRMDFAQDTAARGRRVPAGLVLHISPANVDTMFVYSWALSFLAGNANIVRLTSRASPLMHDVLECLEGIFATAPAASAGNVFVTYGHDDAISARLSSVCDTRILWGGDETIRRLRAVPLSPHAAERAFASKRSLSVFGVSGYLAEAPASRTDIAGRMAADLAPFAQFACSSPHVVYWLGSQNGVEAAVADFRCRLEHAMAQRIPVPDIGWAARRVNHAFATAAAGKALEIDHQPHTTAVAASSVADAEPAEICGAGLLHHAHLQSLDELTTHLRIDHQTITYFGLADADRDALALSSGRAGVDRVVPVGRALDFGPRWDGYNLWTDLTRFVVVQ